MAPGLRKQSGGFVFCRPFPRYHGDLMQLGMIGLGRMGANMVRRLERGGHACVVFDRHPENVQRLETMAPRRRTRSTISSAKLTLHLGRSG